MAFEPSLPTRYCPQRPTVKQAAFLMLDCLEAFYGGAAGGAKSSALLMGGLMYAEEPGYNALILRKRYTDLSLPGGLMDRAREWLAPTDAIWNNATHMWSFPRGGRLAFGYCQSKNDVYRYGSSEFQYIGFDELTEFEQFEYRFLFSRVRRLTGSKVPLRVRSASNPGGPGHDWVKERFIDGVATERVFIPAKLDDNPYIDRTAYMKSLEQLDPVTRRQLLDGDWSARRAGSIFRREWLPVVGKAPPAMATVRAWDLAASLDGKRTAGVKISKGVDGYFYIEHVVKGKWTPGERDRVIRQTAEADGKGIWIVIEQEPGSGGLAQVEAIVRMLTGWRVRGEKVTGDKVFRAGPLASQAEIGRVRLVQGPWVQDFVDELEAFPEGSYADQVDGASLGFGILQTVRGAVPAPVVPTRAGDDDDDEPQRRSPAPQRPPGRPFGDVSPREPRR